MSARPEKILALQFKYFGDAVLLTPALRALRGQFPQGEIHLVAPEEIAPLFQHLPWLDRVWPMPRRRGHAGLRQTWPFLRALRREGFDRSVDFASNDRGAILSRVIGARRRLGWDQPGGFFGRRFCYHDRVPPDEKLAHESARLAALLRGWQIAPPASLEPEIRPDAALAAAAEKILPGRDTILCHVASSQPRKEWPLPLWAAFHRQALAAGHRIFFTTAQGAREAGLMGELQRLAPAAQILPAMPGLPMFLAVLARAGAFISGDTGPLHFAAGLGVPTISLFGPTDPARWGPVGARHQILTGAPCTCPANSAVCGAEHSCLAAISPAQVLGALGGVFPRS